LPNNFERVPPFYILSHCTSATDFVTFPSLKGDYL